MALQKGVENIILGCRNRAKAEAAKASLEESTGKTRASATCTFEVLLLDVSNLESVQKAVEELESSNNSSNNIDCLILNAGGLGGKEPLKRTEYGTASVVNLNVLGSVYLTDLLIEKDLLSSGGHVLYISSEAARGISRLTKCHNFTQHGSVEEFQTLCDGSCFHGRKPAPIDAYGRAKLVGTFWTGHMARQHPTIRFIAVSPGNTAGTNVVDHANLPFIIKCIGKQCAVPCMVYVNRFHPIEVGAQRYLDVLYDDEDKFETGHFYASQTSWPTGPMVDQKRHLGCLYNETYQDNASAAIHSYIPVQQQALQYHPTQT